MTFLRGENQIVRLILPAALVSGTLLLFAFTKWLNDEFFSVTRSTMTHDLRLNVTGRRYSTTDEMRYSVYGVGDHFSPNDQKVVDYIRTHISQPSRTRPRRLQSQKKDVSLQGQSAFVDKLLAGRRDGFFIECGAADGEIYSNSLFFELARNWTGLLIEANPNYHRTLLKKNRRAYVLKSCLGTKKQPSVVRFRRVGVRSGIVDTTKQSRHSFTRRLVRVKCFPLNAIMEALGVSHVDYFSLDVEGPELEILRSIDWTRLHIDVITVEYRVWIWRVGLDKPATLKKLNDLRQFFNDTGIYHEAAVLPIGETIGNDVVFSRIRNL